MSIFGQYRVDPADLQRGAAYAWVSLEDPIDLWRLQFVRSELGDYVFVDLDANKTVHRLTGTELANEGRALIAWSDYNKLVRTPKN